jgi:uncharacterized membrane protein
MSAVVLVLGITNLDFIPLPFGAVTTLHIPVIIAAVLEGPLAGVFTGLLFGVFSIVKAAATGVTPIDLAFLNYPPMAILPRILIGPAAWGVYTLITRIAAGKRGTKPVNTPPVWTAKAVAAESFAIASAAVAGTLVNTVLVLGGFVLLIDEITVPIAFAVFIANCPLESAAAAVITLSVVSAWKHIPRGGGKSKLLR